MKKSLKIASIVGGGAAVVLGFTLVPYGIQQALLAKEPKPAPDQKSELQKKLQKVDEQVELISDASVKKTFAEQKEAFYKKYNNSKESIINKVLTNAEIKKIFSEEDIKAIKAAFAEGTSKLDEILAEIQAGSLEEYNKDPKTGKISSGLQAVKNFLTIEKIKEFINRKDGIADTLVSVGTKVGKYAKTVFDILKTNESTKNIAQLNDLITAVNNKFTGEDNSFKKLADNLRKFDFSKLTDEGYNKTFEKLLGTISEAKKDAVAVLKSVKMSEEDINKVKEVIRPIYNLLQQALQESIDLFKNTLATDLPSLLESLK